MSVLHDEEKALLRVIQLKLYIMSIFGIFRQSEFYVKILIRVYIMYMAESVYLMVRSTISIAYMLNAISVESR